MNRQEQHFPMGGIVTTMARKLRKLILSLGNNEHSACLCWEILEATNCPKEVLVYLVGNGESLKVRGHFYAIIRIKKIYLAAILQKGAI